MLRVTSLLLALLVALFPAAIWAEAMPPMPAVPDTAQGTGALDAGEARVDVRLLVNAATVAPGDRVQVGLLITMAPHWHVYWRNPGQAAYATETSVRAGETVAGPVAWPAPTVFRTDDGFITTFGYEEQVLLVHELTVAADAAGVLRIDGIADYLACRVDCIPGRNELWTEVPVGTTTEAADAEITTLFATAAAALPTPIDGLRWSMTAAQAPDPLGPSTTGTLTLQIETCPSGTSDCRQTLPAHADPVRSVAPDRVEQLTVVPTEISGPIGPNGRITVVLQLTTGADPVPAEQHVGGVLLLATADGAPAPVEFGTTLRRTMDPAGAGLLANPEAMVEAEASPLSQTAAATGTTGYTGGIGLLQALLLALLGGALLNLMPCVLPVLAIKLFRLAEMSHGHRGQQIRHAGAYAAGVMASMLALAAVVVALRATGTAVGWGFQFQEPIFVALVAGVVVVFAVNLFGGFEVGVQADRLDALAREQQGVRASVLEGVLTVVLATPCSAPFLGTAVGFALVAPAGTIVAIFAALGVGLAAPFVLLALTPGLARLLPRPGPWMEWMKQALGFALLAAAAWLVWVLGSAWGADAVARTLLFLLVMAAGARAWGLAQQRSLRAARATLAVAVLVASATGVASLRFSAPAPSMHQAASEGGIPWEPFSPDAVAAALGAGRPVFVDFTADWCITCKVNERTVLADPRVVAAMQTHGVVPLLADWTRRDETIRRELARFGKAGVPMYLVYAPGTPDAPQVLPELLTVGLVLDALAVAGGGGFE